MEWYFWPVAIVLAPFVVAAWGALFMAGLIGIAYVRLRVRECIASRTARADERERRRTELAARARRLQEASEILEAELPTYPADLKRRWEAQREYERQGCEVPEAFRRAWGE